MAKVNALFGKATGKVGAIVFQVNGGVQIMKEKAAKVSNPQTDAQVEQRAKFKLLSQVAAAVSPAIAIPKKGTVSARNQFVSKNIGLAEYSNDTAQMLLDNLQLTNGSQSIPAPTATEGQGNTASVALSSPVVGQLDKVVYASIEKTTDEKLRVVEILSVDADAQGTFAGTIKTGDADTFIYAYGVKFTDANQRARFENYYASRGDNSAMLGVEIGQVLAGAILTETQSAHLE